MSEQMIEQFIGEVLTEDAQKNALEFVAYLRASEMSLERWRKGYWENKLYWAIKYKDEIVCFILINGSEETDPWIIWFDDSDSNCFENYPLSEHMKKVAWENVDFCGNCGSCSDQGAHKTIFGKEFINVCRTTMKYTNPDLEALECMKIMVKIRANYILRNT